MSGTDTSSMILLTSSLLVATVILFYGIRCVRHHSMHTHSAVATITNATCTGEEGDYHCDLILSYTPMNGTLQTGIEVSSDSDTMYHVGDTPTIYYCPRDPTKVSFHEIRPHRNSDFMLIVGGMIILGLPFLLLPMWDKSVLPTGTLLDEK